MKTSIYAIPVAAALFSQSAWAYKVTLNETPVAVQNAVRAQAGSVPIEDIDRDIKNGKVVYEVSFKKAGVNTDIYLNELGQAIDQQGNPVGTSVSLAPDSTSKVTFDQVPIAAQNAIKAQSGTATIEDIDRETRQGRTTYSAAFKRNGQTVEAKVTEDGAMVVNLTDLPPSIQSALRAQAGAGDIQDIEARPRGAYTIRYRDGHNTPVNLMGNSVPQTAATPSSIPQTAALGDGTNLVNIANVPERARTALYGQAQGAPINMVQKRTAGGQTSYYATFQRGGMNLHAVAAEDGALLMDIYEVPAPVQNTIHAQLPGVRVDRIEKRSPRGQDYYIVRYLQNNQPAEMRISNTGQVMANNSQQNPNNALWNALRNLGGWPSGTTGSGSSSNPNQ